MTLNRALDGFKNEEEFVKNLTQTKGISSGKQLI